MVQRFRIQTLSGTEPMTESDTKHSCSSHHAPGAVQCPQTGASDKAVKPVPFSAEICQAGFLKGLLKNLRFPECWAATGSAPAHGRQCQGRDSSDLMFSRAGAQWDWSSNHPMRSHILHAACPLRAWLCSSCSAWSPCHSINSGCQLFWVPTVFRPAVAFQPVHLVVDHNLWRCPG